MSSTLPALAFLAAGTLAFMALSLGKKATAEALRNAKEEWPFILLLLLALGGRAWTERSMVSAAPPLLLPDAFQLLGEEVSAMQSWLPGELVFLFSFLYVLLFPLTLGTAALWLLSTDRNRFRTYCTSMAIASIVLLLAHVLMLSTRPALDPSSGVSPLLYKDNFLGTPIRRPDIAWPKLSQRPHHPPDRGRPGVAGQREGSNGRAHHSRSEHDRRALPRPALARGRGRGPPPGMVQRPLRPIPPQEVRRKVF